MVGCLTSPMTFRPGPPTRIVAAFALAVAATALSGCTSTQGSAAPVPASPASLAPAFAHIHALAVDASGGLLVATHQGLFAVALAPDGTATTRGPIGGLDFDPMGFTLTGGIAYASGHPGPTTPPTFGSPNLGLITSADGGTTWSNVSLTGRTDFHAIAVAPPEAGAATARIFGVDSSKPAIQRSLDGGATWTDGAALVARDILVNPVAPSTLYATTEKGLAVSTDDASTFVIDTRAPALYLVAGDRATGSLAGIDTSGAVWQQDVAGVWTRGGSVSGTPRAVARAGNRLYVADDRGIVVTEDTGGSWRVIAPHR